MTLYGNSFEKMRSGAKTSELRLNDAKRQLLKVGDEIEFVNQANPHETLLKRVSYLKAYASFVELYEGVKGAYPGWDEASFVRSMYEYYTPEQEIAFGALEIGVEAP